MISVDRGEDQTEVGEERKGDLLFPFRDGENGWGIGRQGCAAGAGGSIHPHPGSWRPVLSSD